MERFDAFDEHGKALGFDLIRGHEHPDGAYHKVVQIYTFNSEGQVLITLRDPRKTFGGLWEVTAGSVIKGETENEGALRELKEETGIEVQASELILFNHHIEQDTLWYTYMVKVSSNPKITLQVYETVDYRWVSLDEFNHLMLNNAFPAPMKERHTNALEKFKTHLFEKLGIML